MDKRPVLILGGGINGAAVARELALHAVPVVLVDSADLAFGATAYSSRLIHGGLRYLEYGEFLLVRESLTERARLLRHAPHLVRPLRLFIPVRHRLSGLTAAISRFLGYGAVSAAGGRGLYLVQSGLWMYDLFARDRTLPRRSLHRVGEQGVPAISPRAGKWLCAYSDAQITFPERLVIELLRDARELARRQGVNFKVLTYHQVRLHGNQIRVESVDNPGMATLELEPSAIVNATGAWVDDTLARLSVPSQQLMGGTKGSHLFSWREDLRDRLAGQAVYTEAADGRPVFVLPFVDGTLIGTTDIPFHGDPATAVADETEIAYLIDTVNNIFDGLRLTRDDIGLHYCGVRPLPYADANTPAAITRRHQLVWNDSAPIPLVSLVGGKLTTCRSFAEHTVREVLIRLNRQAAGTTRDRPLPTTPIDASSDDAVRETIDAEWVTHLGDLVERRLMLHFDRNLSIAGLEKCAQQLVAAGRLSAGQSASAVAHCVARLQNHFGRVLN